MKIILDMDQILVQFTEKVVQWWNEDHPDRKRSLEDITSWNIDAGLGTENFLRMCMRCPELWRDLEPVKGAIKGTKHLIDEGHQVRIASAVPKSAAVAYHGKLQWIRDNMPFFNLDNFVAIHKKEELDGDILFDDGLHNIRAWAETGRSCLMLDVPWNRDPGYLPRNKDGMDLVTRVHSWEEFLDEVKHRPFMLRRSR